MHFAVRDSGKSYHQSPIGLFAVAFVVCHNVCGRMTGSVTGIGAQPRLICGD
jgi:hypothetical protein